MDPIKKLARRIADTERLAFQAATQPQLAYSAIEDGAIRAIENGQIKAIIGKQYDGTNTVASVNGPIPPTPRTPSAVAVLEGAVVRWDGEFSDADVSPMDFSRVEIHASPLAEFTAEFADTIVGTFETPRGGEQFISLPRVRHYIRFVTRTQSGAKSEASPAAQVLPLRNAATFSQSGAPENPVEGDIWIDSDDMQMYRWDGFAWVNITTDGVPPSTSPAATVVGGVAMFSVRWPLIENQSEVTYDVHVSTDDVAGVNFMPSGGTLQGSVVGGSEFNVRRTLANGTPLDRTGSTTYFARVIARDIDGAANPGLGGSDTIKRVTNVDIEPQTITATEISDFAIPVKKLHSLQHLIY